MKIKKPIVPDVGISHGGAIDVSAVPQEAHCTRVTVDVSDLMLAQMGRQILPEILTEAVKRAVYENYDKVLDLVFEEIPKQREAVQKELWHQIALAMAAEFGADD